MQRIAKTDCARSQSQSETVQRSMFINPFVNLRSLYVDQQRKQANADWLAIHNLSHWATF